MSITHLDINDAIFGGRTRFRLAGMVLWALMVDIMWTWAGKLYKGLSAPNRDKIFPAGGGRTAWASMTWSFMRTFSI